MTSIGNSAFSSCSGFTGNLTIPNSVTSIGNYAFSNCSGFTGSLTIPNSVTSIGESAFDGCSGFTGSLTIPNSVTSIGSKAFYVCSGLTGNLTIPNSVTSIGNSAFSFCNGLTILTIGNAVTSIGGYAFSPCNNLIYITSLSETPPTLGNQAFGSSNSNAVVNVPCGFESAYVSLSWGGFNNFYGLCGGIVTVIADPEEGGLVSGGGTVEANQTCTVTATTSEGYAFATWTLNGFVVSNNAEYTFPVAGDMTLVAHFVPEGNIDFVDPNIKSICVSHWDTNGDGELSYVEAAAVTDLGGVFSHNSDITSFDELQYFVGLTSIGSSEFSACSGLTSIVIPNSVTSIDVYAFSYCSGLTSMIVLADNPPTLGYDAFCYVNNGIPVYVPCGSVETYTTANWGGFNNFVGFCAGEITVTANPTEGGTVTGGGYYEDDSICTLTATANTGYSFINWTKDGIGVSHSETYSFYVAGDASYVANFAQGTTITFADANVKSLCVANWDTDGDGELSYAEAAAVTSLDTVFRYNSDIISFDELQYFVGLTSIVYEAFEACYSLTSIEIPNSVTSIGYAAFWGCYDLASIEIPNSVTSIGGNAFHYCSSLASIEIPNSVTSIGSSAFSECNGLTGNLTIPNSVTSIGNHAFSRCSGFTGSLTIPNSVTTIGSQAFYYCSGFTGSLTIPNSVTSIGSSAFSGCSGLAQIIVDSGNTVYDSRDNCNAIIKTSTNELVAGCKNTVIPNSVTSIGTSAFSSCSGMTSIVIPNSVTLIGRSAFSYCSGLASMTVLAQTPPTLGNNYVFYNVDKSIPVYVPCGSIEAYQNATGWNEFTNIIGMCSGEIMVTVNPSESGTVTGAGYYNGGDTCVLTATPNSGFGFENWTENGEIVSTESTYTFMVTGDRNLVANFGEITNHWTPNENDYEDNMTFTCVVQLDGVEQRSTLLELGAFCGEECRGSQMATYFAPTDRYIYQMMVFGESNDMISFRLYDHQLQQELLLSPPADVTFNTNGYGSLTNPYVLNFTSTITHTQALNSGWNWWSTYIELNNNDGLSQLENSIGSAGILIKSRNSGYVEAYEYNGETNWYGTLSSISNEQMYKIRTNAECNAIVEGWLANPADHPITINNGWNWIGFPCNQNVGVDEAMSGFTPENNDIIKSRNGYSTYYSDGNYNMWYGTLNTLESGKGYMYRSNSATQKTLVFATGRGDGYEDNITPESNTFRPADGDFADNMTLTAVVEMDGEELRSEDYELAAFVGNECRGSVRLMYVEPVDRYIAFLTIFGEQDEELYFQLTDGVAGSLASDQMAFAADGIVGTLDNPFVMHFGTLDVDESALANVKVYPNPSEGIFNIEGQNIRKVEVFNAFGQSVYSEETRNGFMKLDLTNRAAGIYLIRIVTNEGIMNHQIIKK